MVDNIKQVFNLFNDVETILFCDETKFSIHDNDYDNVIIYVAISVEKGQVGIVTEELQIILKRNQVKLKVFHATKIFTNRTPRLNLLADLTDLIIRYRLKCFCFRYNRDMLFEMTKRLSYLNNDIHDFTKVGYQSIFYFVTFFNTFLIYDKPTLLKPKIVMFFDRNATYGKTDTDEFNLPEDTYIIKRLCFTEKANVSLLALPDFFGYIFRNAKLSRNKVEFGDKSIESAPKVIYSYSSLVKIVEAKLFFYLDIDDKLDQYAALLLSHYS